RPLPLFSLLPYTTLFRSGLRTVDRALLVGLVQQRDVEDLGGFGEARDLVGARRLRGQASPAGLVGVVPAQILQGQPSCALDESALDLAEVDERRQGVPDVVDDVDAARS